MSLCYVTTLFVMQGSRRKREQGRKQRPCSPAPLHPCKEER